MKILTALLLATALLLSPHMAPAKKAPALAPSPQAQAEKERGNKLFAAGHYKKAAAHYTAAIGLAPGYADAYFNRGISWHRMDLYFKAIADFDRSLECLPDQPDVLYFRAMAYESSGQFQAALGDIQRASTKGSRQAKRHLVNGPLKKKAAMQPQKAPVSEPLSVTQAPGFSRTEPGHNAYGGVTTTTIFSRGEGLYEGPDAIYKQIKHADSAGRLRETEAYHHALFAFKKNRIKTTRYMDVNGRVTRVEHHLTGRQLGKMERLTYGPQGALTTREIIAVTDSIWRHNRE